jgi:CDP-archaeol synthase
MSVLLITQLLALLVVANATPIVAAWILGTVLASPLDGDAVLEDGRRLFGASKTSRGIVLSILATSASAPLIGLNWKVGAVVATAAMVGDLVSSFMKRRMGLPSSSRATGLDQIPESLIPLIACRMLLPLTILDIATATVIFMIGELAISPLLFKLHIRNRPF